MWSAPEMVEQAPALPEQHGDHVQLDLVEHAGPQRVLRGVGAVHHHVAVAGGGPGLSRRPTRSRRSRR